MLHFIGLILCLLIARAISTTRSTSLAEDIFEAFGEDPVEPSQVLYGRSSVRTARLVSYARAPSKLHPGFNISMDISGCGRSLDKNTLAGIYNFANGTVKEDATVGDILADLTSTKQKSPNEKTADARLSSHAVEVAKITQRKGLDLLYGSLLCRTSPKATENVPNELRRLLWSPEEVAREINYWCGLLVRSFALGAITALAAGLYDGFLTQWQTPARLGDPDGAETVHKFLRYVEVYGSLAAGSMVFITGVLRWMIGDLVARGLRGIPKLSQYRSFSR